MPLLGERLKQERDARGISIYQVEIDTRIRATILQMLEDGDYAHLPPEPFLRGLVRSYANYLRIDSQDALDLLSVDLLSPPAPTPPRVTLAQNYVPASASPAPVSSATPTAASGGNVKTPRLEPVSAPPIALSRSIADWLALVRQINAPLPIVISVAVIVAIVCIACGFIALTQFAPDSFNAMARTTQTNTRVPATASRTSAPGAAPTEIPRIALTAAPFPTFPGNATATPRPQPRRTLDATTGLNLDIDANGSIKVLVGVDNIPVFNGTMDPGTSRAWTAKESLYFRVEKASDANIYFNGKEVLAANFAERGLMERRWEVAKGSTIPTRTTPFTPVFPTATRTYTPTPIYTITPTSFDTPTPSP